MRAGSPRTSLVLLFAAIALAGATHALAQDALPPGVVGRVDGRVVTAAEFERQWERVAAGFNLGDGDLEERKRNFLEQLLDKEAIIAAAYAADFTPEDGDSARLGLTRQNLMRRAFYQDQIKALIPEGALSDSAELAASRKLVERYAGPLNIRFDQKQVDFLVNAFAAMPSEVQSGEDWIKLQRNFGFPPVAAADTGRVLARSKLGPFTLWRFRDHWAGLHPAQRQRPTDREAVADWVRAFLAQGPMDEAARRGGYDRLPEVEDVVRRERELMASEWYFRQRILARVDTSDAKLRAFWEKNPERYYGAPHHLHLRMSYESREAAEAALAALRAGADWDSLVEAREPKLEPLRATDFRSRQALVTDSPDTQLVAWYAKARAGQAFGPRRLLGEWWIYRFLESREGRRNTFEEARSFVLREWWGVESERLLAEHLEELRTRFGVTVDEKALAAVEVPDPRNTIPLSGSAQKPGDRSNR